MCLGGGGGGIFRWVGCRGEGVFLLLYWSTGHCRVSVLSYSAPSALFVLYILLIMLCAIWKGD